MSFPVNRDVWVFADRICSGNQVSAHESYIVFDNDVKYKVIDMENVSDQRIFWTPKYERDFLKEISKIWLFS